MTDIYDYCRKTSPRKGQRRAIAADLFIEASCASLLDHWTVVSVL
jgi:hypothetical protein